MRRLTLYSRSSGARPRSPAPDIEAEAGGGEPVPPSKERRSLAVRLRRFERALLVAGGMLLALTLVYVHGRASPPPPSLTQKDIDAAVLHTLETHTLPSQAARAYDIIRPSLVQVRGNVQQEGMQSDSLRDLGSGVVIVDNGMILTSLHVVANAHRIGVVFADGSESDAVLVSTQPDHDLAVLRAKTIPDDLTPATLRSTGDLRRGDEVVAAGFPFGIGPSVSAGVISGLGVTYRGADGEPLLRNLIQFDAAVNPGSSGGPLITDEGEVVGIVTAIFNPTEQRVFIGIGFAVPIEEAAGAVGIPPF